MAAAEAAAEAAARPARRGGARAFPRGARRNEDLKKFNGKNQIFWIKLNRINRNDMDMINSDLKSA